MSKAKPHPVVVHPLPRHMSKEKMAINRERPPTHTRGEPRENQRWHAQSRSQKHRKPQEYAPDEGIPLECRCRHAVPTATPPNSVFERIARPAKIPAPKSVAGLLF